MREIYITQEKVALVDDEDFERVSEWSWSFHKLGHAHAKVKGKVVKMHRFILNPPDDMEIDHANLNQLDNRKSNLRLATRAQNEQNKPLKAFSRTGLKGVSRDKKAYRARITVEKKTIYLGHFSTAQEAHAAYRTAAKKHFGEFARFQ